MRSQPEDAVARQGKREDGMRNWKVGVYAAFIFGLAPLGTAVLLSAQPPSSLSPDVEGLIRQSCENLKNAETFSFRAEITYDEVLQSGQKLQFGGSLNAVARRPDRLRTEYLGDNNQSRLWYDGKSLTLFDSGANLYATTAAPSALDELLDHTVDNLGFSVPVADFFYSDPFAGLLEHVKSGYYVGLDSVDGISCHHLALSQEDIDWQIWIEEGERLLPRKLTITYKKLPGSPQYTAVLSDWNFSVSLEDGEFIFNPPADAERIEFLTTRQPSKKPGDLQ